MACSAVAVTKTLIFKISGSNDEGHLLNTQYTQLHHMAARNDALLILGNSLC